MATTTKKRKAKSAPQPVKSYKTYRFINKDPVIDKVRTLLQDVGMTNREVSNKSGISVSTLDNWFKGGVRRPQHASIAAAIGATGYEFKIVPKKAKS